MHSAAACCRACSAVRWARSGLVLSQGDALVGELDARPAEVPRRKRAGRGSARVQVRLCRASRPGGCAAGPRGAAGTAGWAVSAELAVGAGERCGAEPAARASSAPATE